MLEFDHSCYVDAKLYYFSLVFNLRFHAKYLALLTNQNARFFFNYVILFKISKLSNKTLFFYFSMTIRILVFSFLSFTVTPWSQEHFNLEEQTVKFHRFVIAARQHNSYSPSRIFNNCTRHQCSLNYYHPVALSDSVTIEQFLWNAVVLRKNELHHHTNCPCWWEETVTALSDLQGCLNSMRPWLLFHQQGWMDKVGKLIKVALDFLLCWFVQMNGQDSVQISSQFLQTRYRIFLCDLWVLFFISSLS